MATCRDCVGYKFCSRGRNGQTNFYGAVNACNNVEYLCQDFKPTADVVEVKHGEWIDKPTGAYSRMQSWCSACGKHSGIGGIESNRHKPYCPNCGAKMDGKEDA